MMKAMLRVLVVGLAVLMAAGGCAMAGTLDRGLARFETGLPRLLKPLNLKPGRDYVVMVQVPPPSFMDSRNSETLRKSIGLNDMLSNRVLGHLMIAWQCDGRQGMAGQTGEQALQGFKMMLNGWGMTVMVSTFLDGRLTGPEGLKPVYRTVISKGHGQIVAAEVSSADCRNMRRFLSSFANDPAKPWQYFNLMRDAVSRKGGSCLSFGIEMANRAGLLRNAKPALWRRAPVHGDVLGWRKRVPKDVIPYAAAKPRRGEKVVPFAALLRGPLDRGPVVGHVGFADQELFFAALTGARVAAGDDTGWHVKRMATGSDDDMALRRAFQAGKAWASHYARSRIADPDGINALVLER